MENDWIWKNKNLTINIPCSNLSWCSLCKMDCTLMPRARSSSFFWSIWASFHWKSLANAIAWRMRCNARSKSDCARALAAAAFKLSGVSASGRIHCPWRCSFHLYRPNRFSSFGVWPRTCHRNYVCRSESFQDRGLFCRDPNHEDCMWVLGRRRNL